MGKESGSTIVPGAQGYTPRNLGRPRMKGSRPVSGINPYRQAPNLVDQRVGAEAGTPDPGGSGDGADDSSFSVSKLDQKTNHLEHTSFYSEKSPEQCDLEEELQENTSDQAEKKKKNSRQVSKKRVIQAYQDFMSKMKKKGYEVNIFEDRFLELSTNPQTGKFDEKSIFETEGGLELEANGTVKNLRRPDNPKVDLDFVAERVGSEETIFIDHKGMIDFGSLSDKGVDISGFPSHESVAFNMGKDSVDQKRKFIGMDQGPASMEEVVHLYDFRNIRNRTEIPLLTQAVLNGAEQAGYMDGIIFLNYE